MFGMTTGDTLEVGNSSYAGKLYSNGALDIVGPSGANNIVEIQAATGRSSELRLQSTDVAHPFTSLLNFPDVAGRVYPWTGTVVASGLMGLRMRQQIYPVL